MGDAYSAVMDVISCVCSVYSVKAGVPLFLKHIYSEDRGVVALHTFVDIFDTAESSETKGVWRQVESCIGRFDYLSLQVARLLLKNTLRRFLLCVRHGLPHVNGEQGMAQW